MKKTSDPNFTADYLTLRKQNVGELGYGLGRRTQMLVDAIQQSMPAIGRSPVDVIDFGCADAAMLRATAQTLGAQQRSGTGLDVFRNGVPGEIDGLSFLQVDLFKQYPYPIADQSYDIAIASAFMKHHPDTRRFLGEVSRVLRPSGVAVLLDPRPAVVRVGQLIGKFSRHYNPSVWSRSSVQGVIDDAKLPLRPISFERYWVAPTRGIYNTGIEKMLPKPLINMLGLHQCLVLQRN